MSEHKHETPAATTALPPATPKINKHVVMVESCGLRDGAPITAYSDFESVVNDIESVPAKPGESKPDAKTVILGFINAILWQKGALVEFRDQFTTDLEKATGFVYPLKTVVTKKKDGTEASRQVPAITEKEYIQNFRKAIANKELVAFTNSPELGMEEEKDKWVIKNPAVHSNLISLSKETPLFNGGADLEDWLQRLANCGRVYACDAKVVERESKERKLPDYAINEARVYLGLAEFVNSKGEKRAPLDKAKQAKVHKQIATEFAKWGVSCPVDSFNTADEAANVNTLARGLQAMRIAKERVAPPQFLGVE